MSLRLAPALLALALSAGLAGCTSQGESYFQRLGTAVKDTVAPEEAEPVPERSRAELNEIPFATIALSFGGRRTYLVPLADNSGLLDYRDSAGRGVRMLGGAVAGTVGLGQDLAAVRYGAEDPVAHPRPLSEWPRELYRAYEFDPREQPGYLIALGCRLERVARETIEIVELSYQVVRMTELCRNQRREVMNTYWVEPATGFIWKSEQWLGPDLGQVTVEIIRPYSG